MTDIIGNLRKVGAIAHPPVLSSGYDYCGGTPFDIQKKTVELLTDNPRCYVLNSMGTGKTKAALWAFDYLRRRGSAHKLLVVAPLSTLTFTWAREIMETVPHYKVGLLHASSKNKRLEVLDDKTVDIYIINHDGVGLLVHELVSRKDIDVLCIDELAVFRNKSQRTKAMAHLAAAKGIVWGMTGSPTPNAPTDVWNQAKVITPHTVPKFFGQFRDLVMLKVSQFKWVAKKDANQKAMAALQPQVRFTLDDIMELPSFVSRQQQTEMGKHQAEVYKAIRLAAYAETQQGTITAANAGAIVNKLLQISLGWVYKSNGSEVTLDGTDRLDSLVDVIQSGSHKTIVYVPYKHALRGVVERLTADGISVEQVDGETTPKDRNRIFNAFQREAEPVVLAAHPKCVAHGVTLTAADTIVWFGPMASSEIYEQANARIRRVGQQHKQLFLHFWATPMERRIYSLLTKKILQQDDLLKLLEDQSTIS
jgi:SNF2 family DNA or RNA helicase